jgi:hypothetical protein
MHQATVEQVLIKLFDVYSGDKCFESRPPYRLYFSVIHIQALFKIRQPFLFKFMITLYLLPFFHLIQSYITFAIEELSLSKLTSANSAWLAM